MIDEICKIVKQAEQVKSQSFHRTIVRLKKSKRCWLKDSNVNPKKLWTHFILCSLPICVLIAYHLTKSGLLPEIPL